MAEKNEVVFLYRDVYAMMVPSGARILLREGTEVTITQALGGSYTVDVYGNLARIDAQNADALGKKPESPLDQLAPDASLEDKVWAMLRMVYDPEIPVNIVDLGLIYDSKISDHPEGGKQIDITMTLTAPGCGMGPVIAEDAKSKVYAVDGVTAVEVEIVFDPPWDREMMSESARLELGMM